MEITNDYFEWFKTLDAGQQDAIRTDIEILEKMGPSLGRVDSMKRHSLKKIDEMLGPQRVASARMKARNKMEAMLLSEVRKQLGFTQAAVAKAMGVTQSALSQVESQDDLQLSTLRRLVKALGGELDIIARFGERSIVLVNSK